MEEFQDSSLRARVFHKLREDILDGKYQEKDELREIMISEELGVSRTPVREALRQLELEGLVRIIPNKGAYVTGISRKDVQDIFVIRSRLEGLCARWAAERITPEHLKRLEEILLLSLFHAGDTVSDPVVDLDGQFHKVLYEASGSRILSRVLSDFHQYVQQARKASVNTEERIQKSIQEHQAILEAVRAGDAEKADELANTHMLHVIENLRKQGYINKIEEMDYHGEN